MSEIDPSLLEGDMIPQGKYKPASELKHLHEDSDLDIRSVVINTLILMVMCVAAFLVVALVMRQFKAEESAKDELALSNRFNADPTPPGPVLQPDPAGETRAILEAATARLGSYGWNDAEKKSAHIPIERAMTILVERGLPEVGVVDEFHPTPGSSGHPKIGVPPAEAPPAEDPKAEAKP